MKQFYFAAAFALGWALSQVPCYSQSMEDVVYFKNGSVLHGLILEEDPAVSLKIKTPDGNVHIYSMDDVSKILKTEGPPEIPNGSAANPPIPGENAGGGTNPGTAFLLSFLVPGLGCYVNGGSDTGIGVLCDGLYVGGIALAAAAGWSTTTENLGYGYTTSSVTTTPFLWVGFGVAAGGWILGMVDATSYAGDHQAHRNSYGDLFEFEGRGYEIGFNLAPMDSLGAPGFPLSPSPKLALRF
jgi:hypothetical protein